jgi:hypothetical protein
MKVYVGLKEKTEPTIFKVEIEPSKKTHPQFDIIYGPFKSKEDAQRYINAMDQGVACGEG